VHELGLCEDILRAVLRRADGRRVRAARVRIGGHPVDPQVIETNVQLAAAGGPADGIRLDVVSVPSTVRCRSCRSVADAADALALVACRACGGIDIAYDSEDHDLVLESITVDAATDGRPDGRDCATACEEGHGHD
jgi:hydrogenase nickel incorporation protein HypA/HybF